MRLMFRIGGGILLAVIVLLLGAWLWLKSSPPNTNGTVTLESLQDDVEIVRDAHGVPHVFAPTWRDTYIALGYLHAQDRLWQMELTRRAGAGRLAEVVGDAALKNDKLMRALGLYQAAADSYFALSLPVQAALQAYADGVNAFIVAGDLPAEYTLVGLRPEAWQPADSLVWMKLMAYTLGSDWRRELASASMAQKLAPQQLQTLLGWPAIPTALQDKAKEKENSPNIRKSDMPDMQSLLAALPAPLLGSNSTPATASNAWVATNRRSATGVPILANDPHLMLSSPILWYLTRIETPEGSIVGATVPGVPFHVMGMNNELAWGLTTTGADTSDTFVEQVGAVPELYLTPNGPEAFLTRQEVFKVRGADDVTLKIRNTRHGPVISDLMETPLSDAKHVVSLQATYLRGDDTSAEALYWMARARTVTDLQMALRFVQAPVQNITFAERRGNIGMFVAGTIPVRADADGAYPAIGNDARFDWIGIVPKHDLPNVINPNSGAYGNANEAVVDANYPYHISSSWDAGWRGQRLQQVLQEKELMSVDDFAAYQNDTLSLPDIALRDHLLALLDDKQLDEDSEKVIAVLAKWNGHADLNQAGPTIMAVWQEKLAEALFADDLGDAFSSLRPTPIGAVLRALDDEAYDWCDNHTTKETESCAAIALASLRATYEELHDRFGGSPAAWKWRRFNIAPLTNRFWQAIPLFGSLVDNSTPVAGGNNTLLRSGRVGMTGSDSLYEVNHAAGFRAIYDLSDPAASRYVLATGQSGHVLSRYYNDQEKLWANGGYLTLNGTLRELDNRGGAYLTLKAAHEGDDDEPSQPATDIDTPINTQTEQ